MAVQAQYQATLLPDLQNRMARVFGADTRIFLGPVGYGTSPSEDCQVQPGTTVPTKQHPSFQSVIAPISGQAVADATKLRKSGADDALPHVVSSRKRARESRDPPTAQRQHHPTMSLGDYQRNYGSSSLHQSVGVVSTGLSLSFDNERTKSSSPSGRVDDTPTLLSGLPEDLSAHSIRQREELDQFLTEQGERLRLALEEVRLRHSRELLAAIEEGVSRRLREKELELERSSRRRIELEDRVKHLIVEAHMWHSKAKSNEALAGALRTSLQQAMAQSREQSKEGCGDSEQDDAESAHLDANVAATGGRAMKRVCRVCWKEEVSILLLPCRHLCLCKHCVAPSERCPICFSFKSASVEVYMS